MKDIRICFVGDSFVNGTGDETSLGWVGRLCAAARNYERAITCYNLGIRGNTSADILQRWEQECALRLPEHCDRRIVLSCGVNDMVQLNGRQRVSSGDSRENIRNLLQAMSSQYQTLMVGPPPVSDEQMNSRIADISTAYAYEAQALTVPYIDIYSLLLVNQRYLKESAENDGSHPASYGYSEIASIIATFRAWWFNSPGN